MASNQEELTSKTTRFYAKYGTEIEQVKDLLTIKLSQLALAYTMKHNLPREAVKVNGRVKTMASFLKKLEQDGWPKYYYPTEVIRDLIGARIVCWFVDDCFGMVDAIKSSSQLTVKDEDIKDYINDPQEAGYRAIHLFADVNYDGVSNEDGDVIVTSRDIICEIQLRTKFQDAWADTTHEFFYKAKLEGVESSELEKFLASYANRLEVEDKSLVDLRDAYQKMFDEIRGSGKREGLRDKD